MQLLVLLMLCGLPFVFMAPAVDDVEMAEMKKNLESREKAERDVKTLSCTYWGKETVTYRTYCRVNCRRVWWWGYPFTLCQTKPCFRTYTRYVWKEDTCEAEKPTSCGRCEGECCFGEQTCKYQCNGNMSQCEATETFDNEPCKLEEVCKVCHGNHVENHPCPDECPTRQFVQCEPQGDTYTENTTKTCSEGTVFINGTCVHFRNGEAEKIYMQTECLALCKNGDYQADDDDCKNFEQCEHGTWTKIPCAPGTVYDPESQRCDHAWRAKGKCGKHAGGKTKEESCTDDKKKMKADKSNCANYKRCVSGKWKPMSCSPGTKFDTKINMCNHAWAVDCKNRG